MKKVYESSRLEEITHLCSLLESEGIPAFVKNDGVTSAEGTMLFDPVLPELWVRSDDDLEEACKIVESFRFTKR